MNDQSQLSSNPEGRTSDTLPKPGQPTIIIYYPGGIDNILQVYDTIEGLQPTLTLGDGQNRFHPWNHASHVSGNSPSIGPSQSHVATENIGQTDGLATNNAISTRDTPLVKIWQNQPIFSKASTDAPISNSSHNIDPVQYSEAENEAHSSNSLFEDFLNDSEILSMFNDSGVINDTTMPEGMNSAFFLEDTASLIPSSTNNNQMHPIHPTMTPNLVSSASSVPHTVAAAQAAASLPINTINNRFHCTHLNCGANFARAGDLRRHHRTHEAAAYPCTVNGCARRGQNAFHRRDKLLDHMRKKHGVTV